MYTKTIFVKKYKLSYSQISYLLTKYPLIDAPIEGIILQSNQLFGKIAQGDNTYLTTNNNDLPFKETASIKIPFYWNNVTVKSFPTFGITCHNNLNIIQFMCDTLYINELTHNMLLYYWDENSNLITPSGTFSKSQIDADINEICVRGYVSPVTLYADQYIYPINFFSTVFMHNLLGLPNIPVRLVCYKDISYLKQYNFFNTISHIFSNRYFFPLQEKIPVFITGNNKKNLIKSPSLLFVTEDNYKCIYDKNFNPLPPVKKFNRSQLCYSSIIDNLYDTKPVLLPECNSIELPNKYSYMKNLTMDNISNLLLYCSYKTRYLQKEQDWVSKNTCNVATFYNKPMALNLHNLHKFLYGNVNIKLFMGEFL